VAQGAPVVQVPARPRTAPRTHAFNLGRSVADLSAVVGIDAAPEVDTANLRSVEVCSAKAARCAPRCVVPAMRGAPAPRAPGAPAFRPAAWREGPFPNQSELPQRLARPARQPGPGAAHDGQQAGPDNPSPPQINARQATSYVSRRRLDDEDFDPDAVDEEGLPLVYNEERIAAFWGTRPGELAGR
jgi:hypothetical protein